MGFSFHTLLLTPKHELMSLSTLLGYFPALQALLCCAREADTCASDRYLRVFLDVPYQCREEVNHLYRRALLLLQIFGGKKRAPRRGGRMAGHGVTAWG